MAASSPLVNEDITLVAYGVKKDAGIPDQKINPSVEKAQQPVAPRESTRIQRIMQKSGRCSWRTFAADINNKQQSLGCRQGSSGW